MTVRRETAAKPVRWTMPAWMEPFRSEIVGTGSHTVEELMNREQNATTTDALRQSGTVAQVMLLTRLHNRGLLNADPAEAIVPFGR